MPEMMPCPLCGTESRADETACRICEYDFEADVEVSSSCARCGSEFAPGAEFCQYCGLGRRDRRPRPESRSLNVRSLVRSRSTSRGSSTGIHRSAPFEPTTNPAGSASLPSEIGTAPPLDTPFTPASPTPWNPSVVSSESITPLEASTAATVPPSSAPYTADFRANSGLRLVCVGRDGKEGESYPVAKVGLEIGREGDLSFPLDHFISPRHARIVPTSDGRLEVTDLGSLNGVYRRVQRKEDVYPGDHFLLGHQLLRLGATPGSPEEYASSEHPGVRAFGTPLSRAWGMVERIGVGGGATERYLLRGKQIVFGRESGQILFPDDAFMSRQHGLLRTELHKGRMNVQLEDLGSANGTYLCMREPFHLGEGEMFRIGDQLFQVRVV